MIIDCHSHFGNDYYCGNVELEDYIKYCKVLGISLAFLMPTPWPKYFDDDGKEVTSLIWEHMDYKTKIYYSIFNGKKEQIYKNPYKQVNLKYFDLIKNNNSNIRLEYIPLVHGVLDTPDYLYELLDNIKPKAIKMHGFASGFSPEEIKPEICEILRYFDLPIILHTSVYNYNYGYGYDTKYWRNECHPNRWVKFLKANNLKGVLNHGACLNDDSLLEVNRNDNLMIGIGPDLDISRDFFKVDIDKKTYNNIGYLKLLKKKVLTCKLLFDVDFNWNIDNGQLDYLQIERFSKIWNESELDSILYGNAIKYYKLNK